MASAVLVSLAAVASDGWPGRFPAEIARLESYVGSQNPRRDQCHRDENAVIALDESCVFGAPTPPTYAVWGDSHGIELTYALGRIAKRQAKSVMQFTYSLCPPSVGLDIRTRPSCRDYNEEVTQFLVKDRHITTVFMIAAYANHSYDVPEFSTGIRKSVDALLGADKRVVLVYPVPTASANVPRTLARYAASRADIGSFKIDAVDFLSSNLLAFRLLESFTDPNVVHIFPHERLCDDDACAVYADGTPLYFDHQHLSVSGAEYLRPLFEPLF
jgi:hypothetical protein